MRDLWLTGWLGPPDGRRETPMGLYGPAGMRELAQGLHQAFAADTAFRHKDEGSAFAGATIDALTSRRVTSTTTDCGLLPPNEGGAGRRFLLSWMSALVCRTVKGGGACGQASNNPRGRKPRTAAMGRADLWRMMRLLDQQSQGMWEQAWREAGVGIAGGCGGSEPLGRCERPTRRPEAASATVRLRLGSPKSRRLTWIREMCGVMQGLAVVAVRGCRHCAG
ncbi:protein of unknown function [Cupriavidus neocaledonicus]|uniref:Uncharacterized protein n=1 Tax=Cupriavidus neocaledonicus TaxID=1040979 RepID=A0A375H4R7_9BURK|nr:protein of unknown function [Cupriavidus neocaledonicus]